MKKTLLIFIISLIAFSTKAQTYYYTQAVLMLNGRVQSLIYAQNTKVKFNSNSYYDIEITEQIESTEPGEVMKIHLDVGSYRKLKSGVVHQKGTSNGQGIKVIYPADKSSFWLITDFYSDGNVKTGVIYRNK